MGVLGGPWDLVTTLTGVITLLVIGLAPINPFRGIISKVVSPVISSC